MSTFSREPAVIIGLIATIAVGVIQQVLGSGLVTSTGTVEVLNLAVSIIPVVAGIVIRNFVTPVAPAAKP